jgi:hypothetical protein
MWSLVAAIAILAGRSVHIFYRNRRDGEQAGESATGPNKITEVSSVEKSQDDAERAV